MVTWVKCPEKMSQGHMDPGELVKAEGTTRAQLVHNRGVRSSEGQSGCG